MVGYLPSALRHSRWFGQRDDRHGLKSSSTSCSNQHSFPPSHNKQQQRNPDPFTFDLFLNLSSEKDIYEKRREKEVAKMHRTYSMRQSRAPTVSPLPSHTFRAHTSTSRDRETGQKLIVYRPRSFRILLHHHRARSLDGCLERVVSVSAILDISYDVALYTSSLPPSPHKGIVGTALCGSMAASKSNSCAVGSSYDGRSHVVALLPTREDPPPLLQHVFDVLL